jgi:lipopolysaccharide transport system ATP-binding protein
MIDAIRLEGVCKSFHYPTIPRRATLKDIAIRTMRLQRGGTTTVEALKNVSFSVERSSTLGVIGRNGSGKSTLLRILAGILKPDSGIVETAGIIAPLLALGTGFHPELTGREGARIELFTLGIDPALADELMDEIVAFSEIGDFIDAPVRTYSVGMLMRLAFSVAICVNPSILLLDEILAVGDEGFARKCHETIRDFATRGKTIVIVTHAAEIIESWCDTALWLERGEVAGLGDPHAVVAAYHALTGQSAPKPAQYPFDLPKVAGLHGVD